MSPQIVLVVLSLVVATTPPEAQSQPGPVPARRARSDSAERVAAVWRAAERLDSARVHHDSATAAPALCPELRAVATRGPAIGRDSVLARIARGTLGYTFVPVWPGALLSAAPDDSTVVLDGRVRVVPSPGSAASAAAIWMRREFRQRPSGW